MELVLSLYYCPVTSKAEQMKQANFVKTFLTEANRIAEASFHISYMPSRCSCVTNFISNTVNYYTEILKAGFHMIADDRGSHIADDRKESCLYIIADDRKKSQSRL